MEGSVSYQLSTDKVSMWRVGSWFRSMGVGFWRVGNINAKGEVGRREKKSRREGKPGVWFSGKLIVVEKIHSSAYIVIPE